MSIVRNREHQIFPVLNAAQIAACTLEVEFAAGETIWTETSHKYTPEGITALAHNAGFRLVQQWTDAEWAFTNSLLVRRD